jgi:hypothetical protein
MEKMAADNIGCRIEDLLGHAPDRIGPILNIFTHFQPFKYFTVFLNQYKSL